MVATIIDGRRIAGELRDTLTRAIAEVTSEGGKVGLATVLVGDNLAALAYERSLGGLAESVGCGFRPVRLAAECSADEVADTIEALNRDRTISGVLVLRPVPAHLDEQALYRLLDPVKDVEAVTAANAGLMAQGKPRFVPSTPASCFRLIDHYLRSSGQDPASALVGATITIVGRSHNVGRPALWLALERGATVVGCDRNTSAAGKLATFTRQADVLIVAAGVPGLVDGDMVRDGVIAIDVGMNTVPDLDAGRTRLVGDLDFASVAAKAQAITPVPGGVGPVTDVCLLLNTVAAARAALHGPHPAR
jgi:methylenetetrahydrofolate dehydrogenase (NADP+)/methenyltetrahydrofolate cyclohydrolase